MHGPFFLAVWNGIFSWLQFEIRCRGVSAAQHGEIYLWSPGKMHYKTTGCCLSPSLDESLIISSFQLNKSFWAPCWAGCLHLKAERFFPLCTSRVWSLLQGLPDSKGYLGACPGIYIQIWESSFHMSLEMTSILVTPCSTSLSSLLTEKGNIKSQKSLSNHCIRTCNISTQQAGAE